MEFDTKIKIILRDDLEPWEELNVTAFLASGIASLEGMVGEPYEDADENKYLPMMKQPMMILSASGDKIKEVRQKAMDRNMAVAIYTKELFSTLNDDDNRAEVKKHRTEELDLVGIGIRGPKSQLDRITKGIPMHK